MGSAILERPAARRRAVPTPDGSEAPHESECSARQRASRHPERPGRSSGAATPGRRGSTAEREVSPLTRSKKHVGFRGRLLRVGSPGRNPLVHGGFGYERSGFSLAKRRLNGRALLGAVAQHDFDRLAGKVRRGPMLTPGLDLEVLHEVGVYVQARLLGGHGDLQCPIAPRQAEEHPSSYDGCGFRPSLSLADDRRRLDASPIESGPAWPPERRCLRVSATDPPTKAGTRATSRSRSAVPAAAARSRAIGRAA